MPQPISIIPRNPTPSNPGQGSIPPDNCKPPPNGQGQGRSCGAKPFTLDAAQERGGIITKPGGCRTRQAAPASVSPSASYAPSDALSGAAARSPSRRGGPGLVAPVLPTVSAASEPASDASEGRGATARRAPLGKNAKSPSQTPEKLKAALVRRYAMQGGARHLLPGERVQGCGRWLNWDRDGVELWHLPDVMRARFVGVQTCGSVWLCPVCAAKISERRKKDLEVCLIEVKRRGWVTLFLTYTVQHLEGDHLPTLLDGLASARSKATGGREIKKLLEDCGVVGHVRALEITHGENGWHPHIHELLFVRDDKSLGKLLMGLRAKWEAAVLKAGLRAVNQHGFKFSLADTDIAEYVAKYGHDRAWNVEHELTKQVTKEGRRSGRTPMELLAAFTFDGDADAGALFAHYGRSMKGRRQLVWSRGLRADLGLGADKSDQEVAEESDQRGNLLAFIPWRMWQMILADDVRAQLLALAATGDADAVGDFLAAYRPEGVIVSRFERLRSPGREALEREAADVGLTYSEYLRWAKGGIDAIAVSLSMPRPNLRGRGGAGGRRKEVKRRCQEESGSVSPEMPLFSLSDLIETS